MRLRIVMVGAVGLVALGVAALVLAADGMFAPPPADPAPSSRIALAVLGDSNSHSYHDRLAFPAGTSERGGPLHDRTFQWTEVLARLRGDELNQGPWVVWGHSDRVAWLRERFGLSGGRAPRKEDYLYNFAYSGHTCEQLMGSGVRQRIRQAPRLVQLMDQDPQRWRNGVVVIHIGENDWGDVLDIQARDPAAPELRAVTERCVAQIGAAIRLIRTAHPQTRILLVGVLNEADDPQQFDKYRSARETENIASAIEAFNGALRRLTVGDPLLAFQDDMPWFRRLWGARGPEGQADGYQSVAIGDRLRVTNTMGNEPSHALLPDDHAGLAWNTLWAQWLVANLRQDFGLPLTPISDAEVARFVANP